MICLLLMPVFAAGPSLGQLQNEGVSSSAPDLNFIWSITGIEKQPVTMVLNQNGSDIYGQSKYEPDDGQSWNGLIIGSIHEDSIDLFMTILKNGEQLASRMNGTYDATSGLIKGDILLVRGGSVSSRSSFEAMAISPDTGSYTPARDSAQGESSGSLSLSGQQTNFSSQGQKESLLPVPTEKSRFHDVREDADRILTGVGDISQIPIGMSGL